MSDFKLYDFQAHDVERFLAEPTKGGINASCVGVGKTAVATEILNRVDPAVTLILAPPNTLDGWQRAHRLQERVGSFQRLRSGAKGNAAMRSFKEGVPGTYFASYEYARQFAFDGFIKRLDAVVFDEIHRACNRKTKTWQLTNELCQMVDRTGGIRLGLSATPAGNKIDQMYGAASSIWTKRTIPLIGSYWKWGDQFMPKQLIPFAPAGSHAYEFGPEYESGSIVASLPCYWRHEQGHACCKYHPRGVQEDLPPRVVHTVEVELNPVQRKLYTTLERDMFTWIDTSQWPIKTEGLPMLHWLRLLQVAMAVPTTEIAQKINQRVLRDSGVREMEDYTKVTYPIGTQSSKIDAVMDIMADLPTNEKMLVLTHSASIIPAVVDRLNRKGFHAEAWHGGVSASQRQRIKDSFLVDKDSSAVQVIVAQIGAIGEGTDGLQWVCHNEIWMSQSTNRLQNTQALGRLRRDGQEHTVNSWSLVAQDTVEPEQMEKMFVADALLTSALHV